MSRDPDGKVHCCERCRTNTELFYVRDHDEYWCDACISNEAEAAYDRQQERDIELPPESAREEYLRAWHKHQKAHKR